jgi:hypothetical protein
MLKGRKFRVGCFISVAMVILLSGQGCPPVGPGYETECLYNTAPQARAGNDLQRDQGQRVDLDATGSSDPDGAPLSYSWQVVRPTNLVLNDANTPNAWFTAESEGEYELVVTVSDTCGASDTDTVLISVGDIDPAGVPEARANCPTPLVNGGQVVALKGSTSIDTTGSALSYTWRQTQGPAVEIAHPYIADTTFTAPNVTQDVILTFEVTVDNGTHSDTDTVEVTVRASDNSNDPTQKPVANAGAGQTIYEGDLVTLDGSNSSDPNKLQIQYSWSQTSGPTVALSDSQAAQPTFTAPQVDGQAILVFQLIVNNGSQSSTPDTVQVNIQDRPIDCNGNGIDDQSEIDSGAADDCDGNGIPDECQQDNDSDGTIDACESCPNDPDKLEPGDCGCGTADVDSDSDGTLDCDDGCPNDPNKIAPGDCGCGVTDTDTDSDGTADCNDNCPNEYNPDQLDSDGDGVGNACSAAEQELIFVSARKHTDDYDIYCLRNSDGVVDSINLTATISGSCGNPAVSPDGSMLAFTNGSIVTIIDLTSDTFDVLYSWDAGSIAGFASWLDNDRIAFSKYHAGVYMRNKDGSNEVYLGAPKSWAKYAPRLSPDGTQLVCSFGNAYNDTSIDLFVKSVDTIGVDETWTSFISQSESEVEPAWSRDGKSVFVRRGGVNRLYRNDDVNSTITEVTFSRSGSSDWGLLASSSERDELLLRFADDQDSLVTLDLQTVQENEIPWSANTIIKAVYAPDAGVSFADADDDSVPDALDNCPNTLNPDQADSNGNGVGDACESTLSTGLIAYWSFDTAVGGVIPDESDNNFDLTLVGAALGSGIQGSALSTRQGYAVGSASDELGLSESYSISCWVRHDDVALQSTALVTKHECFIDNDGSWGVYGATNDSNQITYAAPAFRAWDSSGDERYSATGSPWFSDWGYVGVGLQQLQKGVWYHYAVTYDADSHTASVYINGQLVRQGQFSATIGGSDARLVVGTDHLRANDALCGSMHFWQGSIDELRLYDRPLSTDEVELLAE